ncbi:hypothetical protein [Glaciecola punicea]|uniref:hypothetical protein n=1 Tax=Glaciecola punicea TaxID=56804 RepID=UPI001872644E|nr:hypothetical protein [Glaciecola punicea]
MKALNDYLFVGGMPDAIKEWTAGINSDQSILKTLQNVRNTQNQLVTDYINDFGKFSEGEKMSALMVERIYRNIPVQLAQTQNEKPIPLEVKSGKNTKAKSLTALVTRFDLPKAYKLSANLLEVNAQRVVEQWPIYLARILYKTKVVNH